MNPGMRQRNHAFQHCWADEMTRMKPMMQILLCSLGLTAISCATHDLITRIYDIDLRAISAVVVDPATHQVSYGEPASDADMQKFFQHAGVSFPPGASVKVDRKSSRIVFRITRQDRKLVDQLMGPMCNADASPTMRSSELPPVGATGSRSP